MCSGSSDDEILKERKSFTQYLLEILENEEAIGGYDSKDDGVGDSSWVLLKDALDPHSTGCNAQPVLRGKHERKEGSQAGDQPVHHVVRGEEHQVPDEREGVEVGRPGEDCEEGLVAEEEACKSA